MKPSWNILRDEDGQDLFEYAVLISLIAVILIAAVTLLGESITNFYQIVVDAMPG